RLPHLSAKGDHDPSGSRARPVRRSPGSSADAPAAAARAARRAAARRRVGAGAHERDRADRGRAHLGRQSEAVPGRRAERRARPPHAAPGLIDCHTHLTDAIEGDWMHRPATETAVDAALRGVMNARITLLAGFTTVRDVGSEGFADVSLMKAIDAGWIPG